MGGFGICPDVVLRQMGDLARFPWLFPPVRDVVLPAHHVDRLDVIRDRGILPQRQGDVGKGAERDDADLSRVGLDGVDDVVDGVLGLRLSAGEATQWRLDRRCLGHLHVADQWDDAARIDTDIRLTGRLEHSQRVGHPLLEGWIGHHSRDARTLNHVIGLQKHEDRAILSSVSMFRSLSTMTFSTA